MQTTTTTKETEMAITCPLTGRDIIAKAAALTARLVEADRRYHAQQDPTCAIWERCAIPAHGGGRMAGIGCERHGIFLSGADL